MRRQHSFLDARRATRSHRLRVACTFLALTLSTGAGFAVNFIAPTSAADTPAFESADIEIRTGDGVISVTVEIAATADQRMKGLMGRTGLARNAGMLFMYPATQPPQSGFWMYHTRIPLDIAFIQPGGRIASIQTMAPCFSILPSACRPYLAGVNYSSALEVNRGFFARHDIKVGDRVIRVGKSGMH
ncbi:MAG: DUF192 domain-containing protein [Gammaproteobacteria bacterium]|nr:DUF192 domain-containing protein [Gammaproteobacteria bacterium]